MKVSSDHQEHKDESEIPELILSRSEKQLIKWAWPYRQRKVYKERLYTDLNELFQDIMNYFGCVPNVTGYNPKTVADLLKHLSDDHQIVAIPTETQANSLRGDSGLLLFCTSEGVELIRPDKCFRHKVEKKESGYTITLISTLPPKKVSILFLLHKVLLGRYRQFIVIILVALLSVLISLGPTWLQAYIFNEVVPSGQRFLMVQIAAFILCIHLVSNSLKLFNRFVALRIELFLGLNTTALLVHRLVKSSQSLFDRFNIGDLQQRVNSAHAVRRALQSSFVAIITAIFVVIMNIGLIYFKTHSFILCLILIGMTLLGPCVDTLSSIIESILRLRLLNVNGLLQDTILYPLESLQTIRSLGMEDEVFLSFANLRQRTARIQIQLGLLRSILKALILILNAAIISFLFYLLSSNSTMALLGSTAGSAGTSTPSQGFIILLLTSFSTINGAMSSLSSSILSVVKVIPDAIRFRPILRIPHSSNDNNNFKYEFKQLAVIPKSETSNSINSNPSDRKLMVTSEESLAITGANSGLCSMKLRMFSGEEESLIGTEAIFSILINDKFKIKSNERGRYRKHVILIDSKPLLLAGTVLENLTDYQISVDYEWLENCMKVTELNSGQESLTKKVATNNPRTSQSNYGWSLRILITRALFKRPGVLLLDYCLDRLPLEMVKQIALHCHQNKVMLVATTTSPKISDIFSRKLEVNANIKT